MTNLAVKSIKKKELKDHSLTDSTLEFGNIKN